MSKKVHELAKELDRSSKEVIAALAEKNVEVKSHMSVLTEEQESMAKKALAPKKAEAAKAEETASKPEGAQSAPPKKKKIIAVYNAHNSQTGIKDPRGEKKAGQGNKNSQAQARPAGTRPAGQTAARPAAGNTAKPAAPAQARPAADTARPSVQAKPAAETVRPAAEVKAAPEGNRQPEQAQAAQARPAAGPQGRTSFGSQGRDNRGGQGRDGQRSFDGPRRDNQGYRDRCAG